LALDIAWKERIDRRDTLDFSFNAGLAEKAKGRSHDHFSVPMTPS
jgi:hypothetical protein